MILKMEKLSAFGLLRDKDDILTSLQRSRCVQLSSPETLEEYEQLREYTTGGAADLFELEQQHGRMSAALAGMSFYAAKRSMFAQKPRVLYDALEDSGVLAEADSLCAEIEKLLARLAELRSQKSKDLFQRASLAPWSGNDLPLEFGGTRDTAVGYFTLPAKADLAELEAGRAAEAPASVVELISEDREQKYLCTLCHRGQEDALWEILKALGASRVSFAGLSGTVQENIAAIDRRVGECDAGVLETEASLREFGKDIFPLRYAADVLSVRIQRGRVNEDTLSTQKAFCFAGWVPETAKPEAVKVLERHGCYYEFREPAEDEEPPILLRNGKLVAPYESITQMYSLPAYRGIDPDIFIAPFFFLFFGMMFSDAGYGLLLTFGGWYMLKKMDLGPGARKLITVLMMGGISTIIWGAVFGSWFGDIVKVVGSTFFNAEIEIPLLLDPLKNPMTVLGLSLALGVVHLLLGMGIKGYMLIRDGKPLDALYDVGFVYITLAGAGMLVAGGTAGTVGTVMLVGGCVGLVLTQGRENKTVVGKLAGGLFALYQILTGTFSDVLSYARILALGLATGVIATVVNLMGSLLGGGIVGAVVLLIVFCGGHALNFAINALGAYVHTSRLHYVEFFGKFYESGGKPFSPFQANTKYITVLNGEEM